MEATTRVERIRQAILDQGAIPREEPELLVGALLAEHLQASRGTSCGAARPPPTSCAV